MLEFKVAQSTVSKYKARRSGLPPSQTYPLGLVVTEPTPAWGSILGGNAHDYCLRAPSLVTFPGVVISLAVIAFNALGDAVRDFLDSRLRK